MKCPIQFSADEYTDFRSLWKESGLTIFEVWHGGGGPLFWVGPDEIAHLKNRSAWRVYDTFEQAYYCTTGKHWLAE